MLMPRVTTRTHMLRRGFTLLESLMAAGILLVVVMAIMTAVTAGQQHAFQAQQKICGTLAGEELISRLIRQPYANLANWNGMIEPVGEMKDGSGAPMPANMNHIGREVSVTTTMHVMPGLGVKVLGRTVAVRTFDAQNQTLMTLRVFVPQPAAETLPLEEDDDDGLIDSLIDDTVDSLDSLLGLGLGLGGG